MTRYKPYRAKNASTSREKPYSELNGVEALHYNTEKTPAEQKKFWKFMAKYFSDEEIEVFRSITTKDKFYAYLEEHKIVSP